MSPDSTNITSFVDQGILQIGSQTYNISVNPPWVTHMSLPTRIMSGFPVLPYVTFEHANIGTSEFTWYVKRSESNESSPTTSVSQKMNNKNEKTSKTATTTNGEKLNATNHENTTKTQENTMHYEKYITNKLEAAEKPEATTEATPTNIQEETTAENWVQVSKGPAYEASSDVIGCRVKCVCRPRYLFDTLILGRVLSLFSFCHIQF